MENKEFLAAPDNELPFVSNLIETRNVDKDEGDINSQRALIIEDARQVRDRPIQPRQKVLMQPGKREPRVFDFE